MNDVTGGLTAAETRSMLQAALHEAHGAATILESWRRRPLSKRGKQRTALYDVHARVRDVRYVQHYQWVGKFYQRDDIARRTGTVLRQLSTTDWATRSALVVPSVVAYSAPGRLLLMTYQAGESVTAAIARYDGLVVRTLGRALAALHATRAIVDTVASPSAALEDVCGCIRDLSARFPDRASTLHDVQLELERATPPAPQTLALLHGDLGPAQLRWQRGRIVVLDIDKCTRGDPAMDLGNLLCQIRRITLRRPGKLPDLATLRAALLDAYRASTPEDPDLVRRVAWYEALTLLRKAHFLASDTIRHRRAEAMRSRQADAIRLLGELPLLMKPGASLDGSPATIHGRSHNG